MSDGETERVEAGIQANGTATQGAAFDRRAMVKAQLMGKNTGVAAILGLLLGGFGLLYASIPLGIIGSVIQAILLVLALVTLGVGMLLLVPWHIFCAIVALVLVSRHNKRLLESL